MNAIERAKNIIMSPNKEWDVIALEQPIPAKSLWDMFFYLQVQLQ